MVHNRSHGVEAFLAGLGPAGLSHLGAMAGEAAQAAPPQHVPWSCESARLGVLQPQRVQWLLENLPNCTATPEGLVWKASGWTTEQRSEALQACLQRARSQGLLKAWRDERFSFWSTDQVEPDIGREPLFSVERSGFRFLGMLSHAVHVNGFYPSGVLCCGRRSLSKATDPGQLDNFTAGGIASGETVGACLARELVEEASLRNLQPESAQVAGWVRTSREEPEGWHDEVLHVVNLTLDADFAPANLDGEVAEFMLLGPKEVLARIEWGEFTRDAVHSLIQGLRSLAAPA